MNRVLRSKGLEINDLCSSLGEMAPSWAEEADHYELLSRGRTRRMTTNAETYSTGNSEEPKYTV